MMGIFVLIYVFNNFFLKILLFGFVFGGGIGEGLIGVIYCLFGVFSDFVFLVNLILVIVFGIFCKMFEF